MRGRRILLIFMLLIGVIFVGVAAYLFLGNGADEATAPQILDDGTGAQPAIPDVLQESGFVAQPDVPSETVEVVVSLQTVPRGFQMTAAELTLDVRMRADVGPNVLTSLDDAIGLYARTDIFQGETLTRDALVTDPRIIGREDYGPSSLIPAGWLATTVPMDRLNSVAYGLAPGDTIDIMMTFAFSQVDQQFQTLLPNSASFVLETPDENGELIRTVVVVDPFGRFEQLPTGDITHIAPGEAQRAIPVSVLLQNARVIQVGTWAPEVSIEPTAVPDPAAPTPIPDVPTPTPLPPDVLVVALPPQQQLFLRYAVEANANIDYALRGAADGQAYAIQNVDLNYLLGRFNIEVPPDFNFAISPDISPTPDAPFVEPPADAATDS